MPRPVTTTLPAETTAQASSTRPEEAAILEEERNKALDEAGVDPGDVEDARQTVNTDIVDVIIDIGAEILLDFIGVNDIKAYVGDGDVWACVSLALEVIPITKVFRAATHISCHHSHVIPALLQHDACVPSQAPTATGAGRIRSTF